VQCLDLRPGGTTLAGVTARDRSKTTPRRAAAKAGAGRAVRGKPAYHHGDLRRVLLDAIEALIVAGGVEALSLREVARAAGVSPAAPYHHFASKAELLGAIAARGFAGLTAAMHAAIAALPDADEPHERLMAIGNAYIAFARAQPTEFRLMFRPGLVTPADLPADCDPAVSFELLLDAVTRLSRVVPASLVTPEALALTAWSLVHGAAELLLDGPLAAVHDRLPVAPEDVGPMVVATLPTLLRAACGKPAA